MDVDWIFFRLLFYIAVWTLVYGTSSTTRSWLSDHYPCFAQSWCPMDPNPTPLPTSKKKFLISLYPSLWALGVAFVLSLFFSAPNEDGVVPSRSLIDKFILISCFMLYTVWSEIGNYFRKMVEIQSDFGIFRDAGLLNEWRRKWEDYLDPTKSTDNYDDYDYTDIA
jgi:hypothetical protein